MPEPSSRDVADMAKKPPGGGRSRAGVASPAERQPGLPSRHHTGNDSQPGGEAMKNAVDTITVNGRSYGRSGVRRRNKTTRYPESSGVGTSPQEVTNEVTSGSTSQYHQWLAATPTVGVVIRFEAMLS